MNTPDFIADIPANAAAAAFALVSFTPDKRGERARADYAAALAEDLLQFEESAKIGGTAEMVGAEFQRYREGCRSRYLAYLHSSSRCASSMITGPANFPTARMQKRNAITHQRLTEFLDWSEMAKRAILRKLHPDLRPIMAGDADAIDRLAAKIAEAERAQERMKLVNKTLRETAKTGPDAQVSAMIELGYDDEAAHRLVFPMKPYRQGFESFELTNNQANIRRMKERLTHIERAAAMPVKEQSSADGIRMEDDPPANRVRLFFPGKPDEAVRSKLKSCGFRWAPSSGAWQAFRNSTSLRVATAMIQTA